MTNPRPIEPPAAARRPPSGARRVLGNSAWLIAAEGGTRVLSLVAILYLSRTLARDGLGIVQIGLALFAVLQLVCTGGVETLFVREAARRPGEVRRLAGQSVLLGWAQLAVALGAVALGTWLVPMEPLLRRNALVFGLAAVFLPPAVRFVFLAAERVRIVGLGTIAAYGTFMALCLVGVRGPDDLGRVALFWMAGIALRAAVQLAAFVAAHGPPVFDGRGLAARFRLTVALGAGSVARGLMLNADVLVLGLVVTPEEVAPYGLATKLPLFLASLATLFYTALFPTLVRAEAGDDGARVSRIQRETVEAVLGVMLPAAVCLGLAAGPLVRALFTDGFADAVPVLVVLLWRLPLLAVEGVYRTVLWARSPEADARTSVTALAVMVALLLAVAPAGGPLAAAWAMLAGDVVALALYARAVGPAAIGRDAAVRIGLTTAAAAGLMLLVPRDGGLLAIAAALAVWAAAVVVGNRPHLRRLAGDLRAGRPS
jgi:O-antigen/teichoic acid export membrane protein